MNGGEVPAKRKKKGSRYTEPKSAIEKMTDAEAWRKGGLRPVGETTEELFARRSGNRALVRRARVLR